MIALTKIYTECDMVLLQPSNIFWKDKSHRILKIGDFGLAVHGTEIDGRRGTSPYCAPESILTAKVSYARGF